MTRGLIRGVAILATAAATAGLAAPASAQTMTTADLVSTDALLTGTTIALKKGSDTELLKRVVITGRIAIPRPNQWVTVTVRREGRVVRTKSVHTDDVTGRYRMRVRLKGCCSYTAQAVHGTDVSGVLAFTVHGPAELVDGSPQTRLFNRLLAENGFHMGEITNEVDTYTGLGILALRKTHDLERVETYKPKLFELLLSGDAPFQPVHRDHDRHVEVDLSRQVMALVENGKATDVFHVSTGAFGTPTGEWSFYSRGPGYNQKGMYYSVYYDGNYATHGYYTVPTYPASHGCTRNPEIYSVFIYNWIELGDKMYVYE